MHARIMISKRDFTFFKKQSTLPVISLGQKLAQTIKSDELYKEILGIL